MKLKLLAASLATSLVLATGAIAGDMAAKQNPKVGGAAMLPTKDIVDNAVNSKDHTTLVAAVRAAGLVDTLKGEGPFTVFAPTNAAFSALPVGTVDTLLKPENKGTLTSVLTYHVVPGKLDASSIAGKIGEGNGTATLTTVQGETLTAKAKGNGITLTDSKGNVASVTIANVYQSNGVIHVIDKVLMP
ncbi:MAG TPA: fasciclin domain-containing protein [Pseudoxanthomonas sp.]|nr:fasciclin domain-containing protein [Pseudoxanthomonas sp.]